MIWFDFYFVNCGNSGHIHTDLSLIYSACALFVDFDYPFDILSFQLLSISNYRTHSTQQFCNGRVLCFTLDSTWPHGFTLDSIIA